MSQLNLSARAYHHTRSVKLARTIADVAESEEIQFVHLADALLYRRSNLLLEKVITYAFTAEF
jgi:magnesium chelatase family protein